MIKNKDSSQEVPYQDEYSDESFWEKIKEFARAAGEAVLEPALKMYYCAQDNDTQHGLKQQFMERLVISLVR